MNINIKYFLLGMVFAFGPTLFWAQSKLDQSGVVLGASIVYDQNDNIDLQTESYDYFETLKESASKESSQDLTAAEPTPTITPSPTKAPQNLTQVASQQREIVPTRTPQAYTPPENINYMIDKYASEYGANPELMKKIAKCESGYNPNALSPSGAYAGIYQFVSSTWVSNRNAMGLDPDPSLRYDAEESIRTAAFKMGRDGYGAWPTCSRI